MKNLLNSIWIRWEVNDKTRRCDSNVCGFSSSLSDSFLKTRRVSLSNIRFSSSDYNTGVDISRSIDSSRKKITKEIRQLDRFVFGLTGVTSFVNSVSTGASSRRFDKTSKTRHPSSSPETFSFWFFSGFPKVNVTFPKWSFCWSNSFKCRVERNNSDIFFSVRRNKSAIVNYCSLKTMKMSKIFRCSIKPNSTTKMFNIGNERNEKRVADEENFVRFVSERLSWKQR